MQLYQNIVLQNCKKKEKKSIHSEDMRIALTSSNSFSKLMIQETKKKIQ